MPKRKQGDWCLRKTRATAELQASAVRTCGFPSQKGAVDLARVKIRGVKNRYTRGAPAGSRLACKSTSAPPRQEREGQWGKGKV
jgi:hypothetical protein